MNFTTSLTANTEPVKEDILKLCMDRIDDGLIYKGLAVMAVIIIRPLIEKILRQYIRDHVDKYSHKHYFLQGIADTLYISDYAVITAYIAWIIFLKLYWG